jgi:polygalacturonase
LHYSGICSSLYQALKLVSCNNLELSQFSSHNSPQMHIAIIESSVVNVWGLNITAPGNSPNTDGVHVERSQGVQITNSTIGTGDDCVSISSGSRFVTVDGIQCGPGHGVR